MTPLMSPLINTRVLGFATCFGASTAAASLFADHFNNHSNPSVSKGLTYGVCTGLGVICSAASSMGSHSFLATMAVYFLGATMAVTAATKVDRRNVIASN